jgi:hypothetical protein
MFRGRDMRRALLHRPDRAGSVILEIAGALRHDRLLGPTRGEADCIPFDGLSFGNVSGLGAFPRPSRSAEGEERRRPSDPDEVSDTSR